MLERARRELHVAEQLLGDPQAGPRVAASHVRELWRCLGWLSRGELPERGEGEPADELGASALEGLPQAQRERILANLRILARAAADPPWAEEVAQLPTPRELLADLRALSPVLRALEGEALGAQRRRRWLARGGALLALCTALTLLAWRPWQAPATGPWRAAYYPSKIFEGRPDLARARDLAFDWGQAPPTESIPPDFYSARFDTCLVLDAPAQIAFMLSSDNGSRLRIDGELRIDNWRSRRGRAVAGETIELGAGVHHLRVEYYEDRGEALLHLRAAFESEQLPAPIPAERLRFPGMELDERDPCGTIER